MVEGAATNAVPPEAGELATIRVGVVRAGRMSVANFRKLAALVQKPTIALSDLTPDAHPFAPQAGDAGCMTFAYTNSIDREAAPLSELQIWKTDTQFNVEQLIGILDCGECANVRESHAAFMRSIVPKFQSALVTRCFAFNPPDGFSDDIPGLVVIPSVGDLEFYVHNMWCDMASNLLSAFNRLSTSIERRSVINSPPGDYLGHSEASVASTGAFGGPGSGGAGTGSPNPAHFSELASPSGSPILGGQSINLGNLMPGLPTPASVGTMLLSPEARLKKRAPGRAQKLIGDLFLLAGRLPEATARYTSAIDQTRANADFLWLASAQEGYYTALLLLNQLTDNPLALILPLLTEPTATPPPSRLDLMSYTDKYREVITGYERAFAPLLVIQASIRLAKILSWIARERCVGVSKLATKLEANTLLMRAWSAITDELSLRFKIETAVDMSAAFAILDYPRKEALFLTRAIELLLPQLMNKSVGPSSTSTQAAIIGSPVDLISLVYRICEVHRVGKASVLNPNRGWPTLQSYCLRMGIMVSEASDSSRSIVYFTAFLLRSMFHVLSREEQTLLLASVQKVLSAFDEQQPEDVDEGVSLFPESLIHSLNVQQYSARLLPTLHRNVENTSQATNPFLYNPFEKAAQGRQRQVVLIKNEPVKVDVAFVNPFAFDLEFQSVVLSTEGAAFTALPTSVVIPARTEQHQVTLSGVPLETGTVTFRGCRVKLFGFLSYELVLGEAAGPSDARHGRSTTDSPERSASRTTSHAPSKLLELQVIDTQPLLKLTATSLTHRTLCLLEGQRYDTPNIVITNSQLTQYLRARVRLTVENIGQLPVDWITVASSEQVLQIGPANERTLSPDQQYFAEWQDEHIKLVAPYDRHSNSPLVQPGEVYDIVLDFYGKYGCTGTTLKIVYALFHADDSGSRNTLITRDITVPIAVSVQKSSSVVHFDVLPLQQAQDAATAEECMLVFDVENSHSSAMQVTIDGGSSDIVSSSAVTVHSMLIPLRKFDPSAHRLDDPIPDVTVKQFVVSKRPKVSAAEESRYRRTFWLKKLLLDSITATWTTSGGVHGELDLSPLDFTDQQLARMCIDAFTVNKWSCTPIRANELAVQFVYRIKSNQDQRQRSLCAFALERDNAPESGPAATVLGSAKVILAKMSRGEEHEVSFTAMASDLQQFSPVLQIFTLPTLTLASRIVVPGAKK
ncbi:hypothetical protein RI367_000753 [Sorochytrium milnesiophthora]